MVIGELAADAAIRAQAVDLAVGTAGARSARRRARRRHQRAGRAGLHAFAAGDAGAAAHRVVEVEDDLGVMAATGHADHVVDLDLAAGAHAEIALDAGIEIDRHRRMADIGHRRCPAGKRLASTPDLVAPVPELRVGSCAVARAGWSATSSSNTICAGLRRARVATGTFMPRPACACRRPPAPARPRSRPCRRGNCRRPGNRVRSNSRDAGFRRRDAWRPARSSRRRARLRRRARRSMSWLIGRIGRSRDSAGKVFMTESSGFGAAWPSPQIEASRIAARSSVEERPSQTRPLHQLDRLLRADTGRACTGRNFRPRRSASG